MRLRKFQIINYRSISKTPVIPLDNNLTIIGPNNEGKSNLVRALVTALRILEEHGQDLTNSVWRRSRRFAAYDWNSDCPIQLQDDASTKTTFSLGFTLSSDEQLEFQSKIGSSINDNLPIEITVGVDRNPHFNVNKQGRGKAVLSAKSQQIAAFIGSKLSINHIAAVRTAREAVDAMEGIVSSALRQVETTDEYRIALETVERLQKPVLNEIEQQINTTLQQFLPNIKNVSLNIDSRTRALRSATLAIDDGQLTPLQQKGDGVISLVRMALLARLTSPSGSSINTILAIEEPESHLHPKAIHNIRSILDNISQDYQVLITTHSPALVDRIKLDSNVLVENNQASIVKDIAAVRSALGVRVSDNLTNSRLAIVCEGEKDRASLTKLICDADPTLKGAFESAEVSFVPLSGSGNLSYIATTLQNSICEPICFLDADAAGKTAAEAAIDDGAISSDDVIYTSLIGKDEAELEDLIDPSEIASLIQSKYKADIGSIPNGIKKRKFSTRLKAALEKAGRPYDEKIKAAAKEMIADRIIETGLDIIPEQNRGPIHTLASLISERLNSPV